MLWCEVSRAGVATTHGPDPTLAALGPNMCLGVVYILLWGYPPNRARRVSLQFSNLEGKFWQFDCQVLAGSGRDFDLVAAGDRADIRARDAEVSCQTALGFRASVSGRSGFRGVLTLRRVLKSMNCEMRRDRNLKSRVRHQTRTTPKKR